jgi:CheY-like chemotaxis protein
MCGAKRAHREGAGPVRPTILVIDDEPLLLGVLKRMLAFLGYDVLGAGSGEEGLAAYREHRDEVDLVILDALMPGMSGAECFRRLRELDPSVRAVVATGTAFDDSVTAMLDRGVVAVLEKPFGTEALGKVVQEALAANRARNGARMSGDEDAGLGLVAEGPGDDGG